jgi:hypothetical protein
MIPEPYVKHLLIERRQTNRNLYKSRVAPGAALGLPTMLDGPDAGTIVHGSAPEFEETTPIAKSFEDWLAMLTAALRTSEVEGADRGVAAVFAGAHRA